MKKMVADFGPLDRGLMIGAMCMLVERGYPFNVVAGGTIGRWMIEVEGARTPRDVEFVSWRAEK